MTGDVAAPRLVGASVLRSEDPRYLTGSGCYVADLELPRMLEAVFVRSPHAHALVRSVAGPSTGPVLSWADLAGTTGPLVPPSRVPTYRATPYFPLAADRVRFVGEAVALALASDRARAEALAEEVEVDYEPLAAVVEVGEALAPGAVTLHDSAPDNVLVERSVGDPAALEAALSEAAVVLRRRFRHGRLVGVPIEGRGCVAHYERARGTLRLWSSTQIPHLLRTYLAGLLGLPEHRVQVTAPDVGGGFGIKSVLSPEEVAVAAASMVLHRPVRWVEDRGEHLVASPHAREQRHDAVLGVDADGTILALGDDLVADNGAYSAHPWTAGMEPLMGIGLLPGPYQVPVYWARARGVATNKSPHAPYRGVARPATSFVMEGLLDLAAAELGLDPVQVRRRNLITAFPHRSPTGVVHDRASYREALDEVCRVAGYEDLRRARAEARSAGRLVGVGVSCVAELTGLGSATAVAPGVEHRYGHETAEVRMDPAGGVTLAVGISSHGQGLETTLAQVAADELGLPLAAVQVVHGDTAATPYGMGTYASRSAVLAGGAVIRAAADLRRRILDIAAHVLEASADDLELAGGVVGVRGTPGKQMRVADLSSLAHFRADRLPPGTDPGLTVVRGFDPGTGTFANAAHLAVVEVDPATGAVRVVRYVVVDDCGVMINPTVVDGQIRGAVAQGIGEALYEELAYDDAGQPAGVGLMDYLVPTASEVPDLEIHHLVTPSAGPGGFKGVGEGGTVGAPAAVAGAVRDALAGAEVLELPIRPAWVWAHSAGAR